MMYLRFARLEASCKIFSVDFAIAIEALELFYDLVMMPCYKWNSSIIVSKDHPLAQGSELTLEAFARFPLVTYVFGFTGRPKLDNAFMQKGLSPNLPRQMPA